MKSFPFPMPVSVTERVQCVLVAVASAFPLISAYQAPPQPAFYGQWLSLLLWWIAAASLLVAPTESAEQKEGRKKWRSVPLRALIALIAVFGFVVLGHAALKLTPAFVTFPTLALLATMLLWCSALVRYDVGALRYLFSAVCAGLVFAALFNAVVSLLQVLAPSLHQPLWIAQASGERPYGNLRQPNLFALLLVWGGICATQLLGGSKRGRIALFALLVAFALALLSTDSRSGWLAAALCVVVFLGLLWRSGANNSQSKATRTVVLVGLASLLAILTVTLLMSAFEGDLGSSNSQDVRALSISQRITLWKNVVELVAANPWTGIGYGQLAFAWLLTPLNPRAADLFDHAHNAPLHLAVELGIPVATALVVALIAIAGYAALRSRESWRVAALMMLLAVATQSLFEYPLWFSFFALPSVVVLSLLCASVPSTAAAMRKQDKQKRAHSPRPSFRLGQLSLAVTLCAAGVGVALWTFQGYRAISEIYASAGDRRVALARAEAASKHPIYGHYGDYAQIMLLGDDAPLALFSRATRATLDERLLTAWARAYERANDIPRARYLVERANEFQDFPPKSNLPLVPGAAASAAAALNALDFK